ncbi:MAG: hypothetical protein IJM83_02655 [Firmicutes bacterium]|nr:hypothetical protein [Bacillota bacterium]
MQHPFYAWDYPMRVTKYDDGYYCWRAEIDRDFEMNAYKTTIIVVGGMCLFMLLFSVVLSFQYGFDSFLWTLIPVVVIMGLTLLLCWLLTRHKDKALQGYEMTDDFVRLAQAKGGYWSLKRAREMTITDTYTELKGKLTKFRVYYPPEDKDLVSGHLMTHVPLGTIIHRS